MHDGVTGAPGTPGGVSRLDGTAPVTAAPKRLENE
jgi:hypothetical protein